MSYKLFLDDFRNPEDCLTYMHQRIGPKNLIYKERDWVIARSMQEFIGIIEENGLPSFISWDHDLEPEHYAPADLVDYENGKYERTGWHCIKWLKEFCLFAGKLMPAYAIHSMNQLGSKNMLTLLNS